MKKSDMSQINMVLQESIEKREYKEPISFNEAQKCSPAVVCQSEFSEGILRQKFVYLKYNWKIEDSIQVQSNNFFEVFWRKIVRRIMGFITIPIVSSQSTYNAQNVKCLAQILVELEYYKTKVEELENRVNEIQNRNGNKCE